MTKQPHTAREWRERLAAKGVMIPAIAGDPKQLWLLVRQDPVNNEPGCFFVTHGLNFEKFSARPGFAVIGHSWDRQALHTAARRAAATCGPQYQPKFNIKPGTDTSPAVDPGEDPWDDIVEGPLHDLGSVVKSESEPN